MKIVLLKFCSLLVIFKESISSHTFGQPATCKMGAKAATAPKEASETKVGKPFFSTRPKEFIAQSNNGFSVFVLMQLYFNEQNW